MQREKENVGDERVNTFLTALFLHFKKKKPLLLKMFLLKRNIGFVHNMSFLLKMSGRITLTVQFKEAPFWQLREISLTLRIIYKVSFF